MGHARLPPGRGRARGRFALQVFLFCFLWELDLKRCRMEMYDGDIQLGL